MTRWHSDDLAGRILASEESKDWTVITIPSILEEKKNDYDPREVGEALWPWKYPLDKLNKIKTALGPHYWAALYQGSPVARGGTLFKSQNFRYHTIDMNTKEYVCERMEKEPIRVKINELTKHCYVDPAIEIKTSNDPTGMAAWGYSRKYKIWLLLDTISERIEHNCVMDRIKSFASKWDCTLIGIENEKLGKVLVKQSQGNDMIGGKKIPFKEIKTGGVDKYARATPMATYQGNERVFFPKYASWLSEYEDTLVKFPNVGHDEYVDITSMAQHMETAETLAEILSRM